MRATLEEEGVECALFLCNETEVRDSMQTEFDTIAAISTAPGEGAIGIVRISGEDAIRMAHEAQLIPSIMYSFCLLITFTAFVYICNLHC